jgi:catechol 2,3-dioxygenase-like lactoylglutathione lyase family enzyme
MKLDHIVILLSNLEANLAFYEALLPLIGFSKDRDHVFANEDGVHLDFRQAGKPGHRYERFAPGLNHLGFTAPDRDAVETIRQTMANAGFEVPEIQEFPNGSALFLKDADGMRIEVSSYYEG